MKNYKYLFFDLDGTLTDPAHGLVEGFVYAFKKLGIPYSDKEELKKYIGPPLYERWKEDFGMNDEDTDRAVLTFREYYNIYGWWDNKVYEGIREMLTALKASGKRLFVATSKPEDTARRVLSYFNLSDLFEYIGGAGTHKTRDKKWEVLSYVISTAGLDAEKDSCIMIGDRVYDKEGAAICGIDSLGVRWGHGTSEELDTAGFDYTVSTPAELVSLLSKNS